MLKTKMNADLEPLVSLLRIFPDGAKYGDPYTFCATVRHPDRETAEIMGTLRSPTLGEWRAIRNILAEKGMTKAIFTRIKNGIKTKHEVRLRNDSR